MVTISGNREAALKQAHSRIQAVMHNRAGRTIGAIEAHERNVLAITRRIHALTTERAKLRRRDKVIGIELRAKRRELRTILQRDSYATAEQHEAAGLADAIDASETRRER